MARCAERTASISGNRTKFVYVSLTTLSPAAVRSRRRRRRVDRRTSAPKSEWFPRRMPSAATFTITLPPGLSTRTISSIARASCSSSSAYSTSKAVTRSNSPAPKGISSMEARATRSCPASRANCRPLEEMSNPKVRPYSPRIARLAPVPHPQSRMRADARPERACRINGRTKALNPRNQKWACSARCVASRRRSMARACAHRGHGRAERCRCVPARNCRSLRAHQLAPPDAGAESPCLQAVAQHCSRERRHHAAARRREIP